MKADFWQLERDPADKVVALIAGRVLAEGERLLVVAGDAALREAISAALWDAGEGSFLANGQAGGPHDARQPVLIAKELAGAPANGASHVIFADGVCRAADGFARAFLLFGEATIEAARACWRGLDGAEGLERAFYRQDGGRWVKVA
ncbi:DNA polymerase III subunit chi [Qipengyuania sp. YIM B01966]|uniref:DNA polymerase III subunit chi n=1 Tax=Qipengyuania sp. YIM B01966 TaxID=2778646 RepID=UPI0018F2A031